MRAGRPRGARRTRSRRRYPRSNRDGDRGLRRFARRSSDSRDGEDLPGPPRTGGSSTRCAGRACWRGQQSLGRRPRLPTPSRCLDMAPPSLRVRRSHRPPRLGPDCWSIDGARRMDRGRAGAPRQGLVGVRGHRVRERPAGARPCGAVRWWTPPVRNWPSCSAKSPQDAAWSSGWS